MERYQYRTYYLITLIKLKEKRPRDIDLQVAVSNRKGSAILYEIPETGLSTLSIDIANFHKTKGFEVLEKVIEVTTLSKI